MIKKISIYDLPKGAQELLPVEQQLLIENRNLKNQLEKAEAEIDRLRNENYILQEQLEQRSVSV